VRRGAKGGVPLLGIATCMRQLVFIRIGRDGPAARLAMFEETVVLPGASLTCVQAVGPRFCVAFVSG
jgi:hypothetical protein